MFLMVAVLDLIQSIAAINLMFKAVRIAILLVVLVSIAIYTKTQRLEARAWTTPLQVVIYPINAENNPATEHYIQRLTVTDFQKIERFFSSEAKHYGLLLTRPFILQLGEKLTEPLPLSPLPGASYFQVMVWSLRLRYWAFMNTPDDTSNFHRIRAFVYYYQPRQNRRLQHSLGLEKGLLVIAHAFANPKLTQKNNIIIAHEILHTVGATDKYDLRNQPIFPEGYAEPEKKPLYPQRYAEIMAVKTPLSSTKSKMPDSLDECIIGTKTAEEINWITSEEYSEETGKNP